MGILNSTIASSTIIPSANNKENKTITFIDMPRIGIIKKATKQDSGTANPTKKAFVKPMKNMSTNTTKIKPRITVFIKSWS